MLTFFIFIFFYFFKFFTDVNFERDEQEIAI